MYAVPPDPDVEPSTPAPRVARAEARLAMLRELSELGMAMTRDLTRRTLAASDAQEPPPSAGAEFGAQANGHTHSNTDLNLKPKAAAANAAASPKTAAPAPRSAHAPRHDPAESFARLSRAIRLTLAQEAKAEQALDALLGQETEAGDHEHGDAPFRAANDDFGRFHPFDRDHASAQRNRIRDHVFGVINNEITDVYRAHEILNDLHVRMIEGDRYDAFVFRPAREAVAAICDDLGLHPDWSLWTDDGWPPPPPGPRRAWERLWAPDLIDLHQPARRLE